MKSVLLNGIEIKVGSVVRFINDTDLYIDLDINKPILYGYYIVRGFSDGGFLLEGIINEKIGIYTKEDESEYVVGEPGFAFQRFTTLPIKEKTYYKVNFKIKKEVVESLDLKSIKSN